MCVPYCDPGAVPSAPRGVGGGPGRAHGLPALRAQGSEWRWVSHGGFPAPSSQAGGSVSCGGRMWRDLEATCCPGPVPREKALFSPPLDLRMSANGSLCPLLPICTRRKVTRVLGHRLSHKSHFPSCLLVLKNNAGTVTLWLGNLGVEKMFFLWENRRRVYTSTGVWGGR